jgi:hypothetical protein
MKARFDTARLVAWKCMQARKGETISQKVSLKADKDGNLDCILDEKSRLLVKPSIEMVNAWHVKQQESAAKRAEKTQAIATAAKKAADAYDAKSRAAQK